MTQEVFGSFRMAGFWMQQVANNSESIKFLDRNWATDPPLDSSRRTLSEKLDRVSSRCVSSQEIAPKINDASAAEPPETSPTVLALIWRLSPDVSANNLKTLSVKDGREQT